MPTVRQRYRQTDGQTDGRTTYDSNIYRALHYVHRAVKTCSGLVHHCKWAIRSRGATWRVMFEKNYRPIGIGSPTIINDAARVAEEFNGKDFYAPSALHMEDGTRRRRNC